MTPIEVRKLISFLVFALAFVTVLTLIVRLGRLYVRGHLRYTKALGLTALFIGLCLGVWWFLTRGQPGDRIVQSLILPSPMEVVKAFGPLHFERGLIRSIFTSWFRVTAGFTLAALVAV